VGQPDQSLTGAIRRLVPMRHPSALLAPVLVGLALTVAPACSSGGNSSEESAGAVPAEEYKVTVAGDSISVGLGASLRNAVDPDVTVKVIGEGGTGLARPDNFDWPTRLETLARDFPPQVLVLSLGSNDAQDLTDSQGNSVVTMADADAWDAEYRRRLAQAFDAFEGTDTTVVWVGHVRTADEQVGATNRHIHDLATDVASTRDWVQVEDLADLAGIGADRADRCLIGDGLHLTVECLDDAADALADELPDR